MVTHSVAQPYQHPLPNPGYRAYAFEFELDQAVDEALRQIRERGYLEPYADSPKKKIAVGVNFSSEERKVEDWKVEALEPRSS
ncbi:MAG: PD-(D/E)XK nuclease domain-containing protein [Phaeodactylibacter sp.]|nr:PD-(D/E)XK nuclease domain-containing protein [Phaeodactylibacter sp.]